MLDKRKLHLYLSKGYNVLFVGERGTGKTTVVLDVFREAGLKFKYFSAPTMDPWVDFVGVPKEKDGYLELILPKDFADDEVEAIFLDEYNRAKPKTMSAVMELIQFKSINGRRFSKLKAVWASINPPETEDYEVEKLDKAQEDRFHIKIKVPYNPSVEFFEKKYGSKGKLACDWWKNLKEDGQKLVSPRRLDYALDVLSNSGDVRDVFDEKINVPQFLSYVNGESVQETIKKLFDSQDNQTSQEWLNIENNYNSAINDIMSKKEYKAFFLPLLNEERLSALVVNRIDALKHVAFLYYENDKFMRTIDKILSNTNDHNLRKNISIELDNAILPVSIDMFKHSDNPFVKTIYSSSDEKLKAALSSINDLSTTEKRRTKITEIHTGLTKNLDQKSQERILQTIDIICMKSHRKTILNLARPIMETLNHILAISNTTPFELCKSRKYIYNKVYSCKLFDKFLPMTKQYTNNEKEVSPTDYNYTSCKIQDYIENTEDSF